MADEPNGSSLDRTVIANLKASGSGACPSCGGDKLKVFEMAVLRRLAPNSSGGFLSHFLIPVECLGCGHVRLFSAKKLGVKTPDEFDVEGNY